MAKLQQEVLQGTKRQKVSIDFVGLLLLLF